VKTATQQSWPADQVERWPVDKLVPYARNSRTHSDTQVAQIAASIKEWGWTTPVLVSEDGTLIAGHGRVMAARKLGLSEVPVMIARGWTEAQRRAYVVADNQLALNAGWDMDLLSIEMQDLNADGFDLSLIGFDDKMLDALLADKTEDGLTDPDDVPEPPADPVSKLGDVWVMDRHRLICGSSTEADTVGKLLGDVKPHLMVTDPPYGVQYDANWRASARNADGSLLSTGNDRATGKVMNDDRADWSEAWELFPGEVAYVWHGSLQTSVVLDSLAAAGMEPRSLLVWVKSHFAISRGHYHPQHEPCWYVVRKGATGHWAGDRKQSTVWQIDKPQKSETGHSTQKPVECMKRPIENNSSPGQAIYEPFSGSGTTIIAGEMTGRHVYAVELNPAYVDVAVKRWQEFTGKTATLEGDGRTFSEISEASAK
jgi:DNA modification methylase